MVVRCSLLAKKSNDHARSDIIHSIIKGGDTVVPRRKGNNSIDVVQGNCVQMFVRLLYFEAGGLV